MDFIKYEAGDRGTWPIHGLRVLVEMKKMNPVTKTPWKVYCKFDHTNKFKSLLYGNYLRLRDIGSWAYAPKETKNEKF